MAAQPPQRGGLEPRQPESLAAEPSRQQRVQPAQLELLAAQPPQLEMGMLAAQAS